MRKVLYLIAGKIEDIKNFTYYVGCDPQAPSIFGFKILYRQFEYPVGVNDTVFVLVKNNRRDKFMRLIESYNLKAVMTPSDNNVIHMERLIKESD